jgi:HPt (histidine-containing phosphotransfer) domain-containing protein
MNDHIGKPFDRRNLYRVVDRWLPDVVVLEAADPAPARDLPLAFNPRIYDDLAALLGNEKIDRLVAKLENQLRQARLEPAQGDDGRLRLAGEAHGFVTQAGMLGFLELSETCRALETACRSGDAINEIAERARIAMQRAGTEIAKLRNAKVGMV